MTFFYDTDDCRKELIDRLRDSADESPNGHYAARHAALEIAFWLEGRLPMANESTPVIVEHLREAASAMFRREGGKEEGDDQ